MKMDKKLSRGITLVFAVLVMGLFLASVCAAEPTVPSLISPGDGATLPQPSEPWTFDWTDSSDPRTRITQYELYVRHKGSEIPIIDDYVEDSYYSKTLGGYVTSENLKGWTWRVRAQNDYGYWSDWSETWTFDVEARDTTPPTVIENTPTGENVPVTTEITVTFSEPMNKESAEGAFSLYPESIYSKVSGKFDWDENMMIFKPSSNLDYDTRYAVGVGMVWMQQQEAMDLAGNSLSWYEWEFTTGPPNNPPNVPNCPSGQNSGYIRTSYSYSTSAEDPDGDGIKYTFDWGDFTTSATEFVDSGETASLSHDWAKPGDYRIRVKATDDKGASSRWSELLIARILAPIPALSISISTDPVASGESDEIKVQVFSDGDPVPGASIHLTSTIGDLNPEEGKTNYNGEFTSTFTAPPVDTTETYTIHAEAEREGQKVETSVSDLITVTTSPTAIISATPTEITEGESVSFSATDSADPDGDIVSYNWDFGDGDTDAGISVEHTYPHSGHYTVTLTVTDNDKLSDTDTEDITVKSISALSVSIATNPVPSGESDEIKVQVFSNGNPVAGANVYLSSTLGSLYPIEGETDDDGVFVSTYTAPLVSTTQRYTISAVAEKEGYEEGIVSVSDSIFVEQPPTTTPAPVVTPIPTPEETPTSASTPPPSLPIVPIAIAAIAAVTVLIYMFKVKKPPEPHPGKEKKSEPDEEEKQQYGSISASSNPKGAVVFLDGAYPGRSPITRDNILIGPHIVVFAKLGYFDCKREATVNANQTTHVHCDLTEIPEIKLKLSAEPTEITADGKSKSTITIRIEDNNGIPIPVPEDVTVELVTNIGTIESSVKIPAGPALVTATLTSSTVKGTATVEAKVEFLKGSTTVEFL